MVSSSAEAQKLYDDVMTYIRDAREITERGEYIVLEKLDERVQNLCLSVQNLKIEDSLSFKDQLVEMMSELNDLQTLYHAKRESLAQDISGVGKHKQAAMAYKQQEATAHAAASAAENKAD